MDTSQALWQDWIAHLQKWGWSRFAVSLLEALSPAALASAQVIHFGTPILGTLIPGRQLMALANLLEDDDAYSSFINSLKVGDAL